MECYVYKIIFSDGKWYYGVRRIKEKPPQSDGYYGSPVTNKSHWVTPHSKIVLKEFKEWEDGVSYENALIKLDLNNPKCLNECANLTFSYDINRSAREKAARLRKGKPLPDAHRLNISKAQKGKSVSQEEKERLRTLTLGMSWWNNGEEEIFVTNCPGKPWVKGRLKDCFKGSSRTRGWKWFHKDGERKMFKENPGGGWQPGRKGYNSHKPGKTN
jgi:hypothetical protein